VNTNRASGSSNTNANPNDASGSQNITMNPNENTNNADNINGNRDGNEAVANQTEQTNPTAPQNVIHWENTEPSLPGMRIRRRNCSPLPHSL
jgi:hypothetical protein